MKTEISVIIPFYENFELLKRAIESVLNQSFKKFELIIIFDNPFKSDLSILEKMVSRNSKIKLIINKKNLGAGLSRNKGIKIAKGKYISFLDSDDYWKKNKLLKQINFMKKNKLLATHSTYDVIDEKNNFIKKRIAKNQNYSDLLNSCDIGLSTVMVDRKLLKGKYYFPKLKTKEDYVLWLRLSKRGFKFYGINKYYTYWMYLNNSLSSSIFQKMIDGYRVYRIFLKKSFYSSFYHLIILSLNFLKK